MKIILSVGFGEELYQRDILLLIILVQDIDLRVLDGGEQFAPDLVQCVVSALLILMVPDFAAFATNGQTFTVFGIPATVTNYAQTVLPVMLSVLLFCLI